MENPSDKQTADKKTDDQIRGDENTDDKRNAVDPDAPGRAASKPLSEQPDVEPNEPA